LLYNLKIAIGYFFEFVGLLIIVDVLSTWFRPARSTQFSRMIGVIIDPIIAPFQSLQRKLMPSSPIDFSPMLAILFLEVLKGIIYRIL
jgi:YggT family protein